MTTGPVELLVEQAHDPPIFRIPLEIVGEIFIHHIDGTYHTSEDDMKSKTGQLGPLLLIAICRSWREIALAMPRLWMTINILVYSLAKIPPFAELTGDWIARSSQLPLTLSLSFSAEIVKLGKMPCRDQVSLLFDTIRQFAPSWHRLTLCIPTDLYEPFIGGLTFTPLLEDILLIPAIFPDQTFDSCFRISEAPRLKHLEFSFVFVDKIKLPLQNLTSLEVNSVCVDEMVELLRTATQLVSAKFSSICADANIFPFPTTPLIHHSLRRLDLLPGDTDTARELDTFLENIVLPALERFVYHSKGGLCVDGLLSLFTRSRSPLAHFEIVFPYAYHDPNVAARELIRLLSGIPTITTLSLSLLAPRLETIVTDDFFRRFDETPHFLPHLEVLSFVGWRGFSWGCVADLLQVKQISGFKIRMIDIVVYHNMDDDSDPSLLFISENDLSRLLHFAPQGARTTLNIVDNITRRDIIATSLAFHGVSR
ncbi:hypothetical protein GALMADRAFT_230499 [Galerina marginata CBS 339.88]|uniref:F-box domain-containing protein n=1 Tax=Galerina marginata (strain CBS 339.88) TaxID=685588 RepID=A0A067SQ85_GALM3|nr:hypothetical protein GALMADRAFT_230499 [Galerina marginata CBS 339.88]